MSLDNIFQKSLPLNSKVLSLGSNLLSSALMINKLLLTGTISRKSSFSFAYLNIFIIVSIIYEKCRLIYLFAKIGRISKNNLLQGLN